MASNGALEPVAVPPTAGKSKNRKKKKNKHAAAKHNGEPSALDTAGQPLEPDNDMADDDLDSPQVETNEDVPERSMDVHRDEDTVLEETQPIVNGHSHYPIGTTQDTNELESDLAKETPKPLENGHADVSNAELATSPVQEQDQEDLDTIPSLGQELPQTNGHVASPAEKPSLDGPETHETQSQQGKIVAPVVDTSADTEQRLEAAVRDRDQLRAEVTQLRRSLESIQQRHEEDLASLSVQHEEEIATMNARLGDSQSGKEHAEGRYQKLLSQVNTIKMQLGERLKADAADLSQARTQIDELEEQNKRLDEEQRVLVDNNTSLQSQVSRLSSELISEQESQAYEISNLRNRANLSQQNWAKERDDLLTREAQAREEFESARQAMQDWEVLAMEERSIREGLGDRVAEVEEQLSNQREAYERAAADRDSQSVTVDGLQRALQDIQEARKVELREMVETSQAQLEDVGRQLKIAEEAATTSQSALEAARQDLERALPFEKEVKEKNLLIGKLRHEAVILNDHLTKALRYLKKGKPDDTIDRQLITNHFQHFLALDRSDPKKFQVLQLISALLHWTDEQNESAGLARPGASSQPMNPNNSLRAPLTPLLRRVSSNASLNPPMSLNSIFTAPSSHLSSTPELGPESPGGKESLAELWSGFLEREAQDGMNRQPGSLSGRRETMVSPTSGNNSPRIGYSRATSRSGSMSGQNLE